MHSAVNACLMPLLLADHCHVTTIEGSDAILREVQARFADGFASQCGFCSPGMIMSLYAQLRNKPASTNEELQMAIDGNLCRCTGYRPILGECCVRVQRFWAYVWVVQGPETAAQTWRVH